METDLTPELVQAATTGDAQAQERLVRALTPEIQLSVGKMLRRWHTGSAAARDLRQEMEDLVQEGLLELFEDDAKVLRGWNPERLPLEAYAGYIARIRTAEVLRSRRSPWREEPRAIEDLDSEARESSERAALARDVLRKLYLCLAVRFKPTDFHLLDLLVVREKPPQEVADTTGKSVEAIYQWRSRLYKRARECREKMS